MGTPRVPPAVMEALAAGPCLVLLIGTAGAGKSTLAALVKAAGVHVLSLDGLRAEVSGNENDQEATGDAVAVLHMLAAARLRRRLSTVIDATNVEAGARRPLLEMARQGRVPAVAVIVDTPLEECLARNEARPGPAPGAGWGRRVPGEVVRDQHASLLAALPGLAGEGFATVIRLSAGTAEGVRDPVSRYPSRTAGTA